MIIVDRDIKKLLNQRILRIETVSHDHPFDPSTQIGAGSIDLRLSPIVRKYKNSVEKIDLSSKDDTEAIEISIEGSFIYPGEIWIATTIEIVILPSNIAGLITGRSSIARLGLLVQCSQDYIQPGHSQLIPLQLVNVTNRPISIKPYLAICQLALFQTTSKAEQPYSRKIKAKYSGELIEPEPSKIGIEAGTDSEEDLQTPRERTPEYIEIVRKIGEWKEEVKNAESKSSTVIALNRVLFILYIIMGACISNIIGVLREESIKANNLILPGCMLLLVIILVFVAKWRRS